MLDSCRFSMGAALVVAVLCVGCGQAKPTGTVATSAPGAASSNLRPKGMDGGAPSQATPGQPQAGKPAGPQVSGAIEAP